jgi:hypothetical protein
VSDPDLPDRMSAEDRRLMYQRRRLNVLELLIVARAKHYADELVMLTASRGVMEGFATRPTVHRAAQQLLKTIIALEAEMEPPQ